MKIARAIPDWMVFVVQWSSANVARSQMAGAILHGYPASSRCTFAFGTSRPLENHEREAQPHGGGSATICDNSYPRDSCLKIVRVTTEPQPRRVLVALKRKTPHTPYLEAQRV